MYQLFRAQQLSTIKRQAPYFEECTASFWRLVITVILSADINHPSIYLTSSFFLYLLGSGPVTWKWIAESGANSSGTLCRFWSPISHWGWTHSWCDLFYYSSTVGAHLLYSNKKKKKKYLTFERKKGKCWIIGASSRGLIRRDQILLQVVQDSFLINRQIPRKNDEPDKDTNDLEGQGEITLRRSP